MDVLEEFLSFTSMEVHCKWFDPSLEDNRGRTTAQLGPHDVGIRMKAVGICESDDHYFKTLRCADSLIKELMVIDHRGGAVIIVMMSVC